MGRIKKYEEISNYWVYSIKVPSINKYYIGISKRQCCDRWKKSLYKGKSLEPYIDEWDSMEKTVLVDNLSKKEALKYEDNIIRALSMNNLCLNSNRSGMITVDIKTYQREYYENNKEKMREYQKQYREDNKEKISEQRKQQRLKKKLRNQLSKIK